MVKRCQNIYFIGLKKELVWGVLERGDHDKNNETGLKEGRRNRNVNLQCFPYTRCTLSFALNYLPEDIENIFIYCNKSLSNIFLMTVWGTICISNFTICTMLMERKIEISSLNSLLFVLKRMLAVPAQIRDAC